MTLSERHSEAPEVGTSVHTIERYLATLTRLVNTVDYYRTIATVGATTTVHIETEERITRTPTVESQKSVYLAFTPNDNDYSCTFHITGRRHQGQPSRWNIASLGRPIEPTATLHEAMQEAVGLTHELHAKGQYIDASPLHPVSTATCVRVRDGKPIVTDGPFAETKEQLAGYVLIEAPDLDAAQEIALSLPPGRVGLVEVRPVWEREDLVARRVTADRDVQVKV